MHKIIPHCSQYKTRQILVEFQIATLAARSLSLKVSLKIKSNSFNDRYKVKGHVSQIMALSVSIILRPNRTVYCDLIINNSTIFIMINLRYFEPFKRLSDIQPNLRDSMWWLTSLYLNCNAAE